MQQKPSKMKQISQNADAIRQAVREQYGNAAATVGGDDARTQTEHLGYHPDELDSVPDDANLGLGCGNPAALAKLQAGDVVVDLGSGGGLDALLAAKRVGADGRVIGIDMTPAMLGRARKAAVEADVADRVEFREGLIEALPVVSGTVDVVLLRVHALDLAIDSRVQQAGNARTRCATLRTKWHFGRNIRVRHISRSALLASGGGAAH